jgi:hypothetical protein
MTASKVVCIASYPKSGNTWMRLALQACLNGGRIDALADLSVNGASTFGRLMFQRLMGLDPSHLTSAEFEEVLPEYLALMARQGRHVVLMKTHGAARMPSGKPMLRPAVARLVVHLVRDPRDVAVSWAHHRGRTIDEAIAMMADDTASLGDLHDPLQHSLPQHLGGWSRHVESWLDAPEYLRVLTLRYEDRLSDPLGTLALTARRAGVPHARAIVEAAVAATDFRRVAAMERSNGFRERPREASRFFRHGRAGGWRSVLTADQIARIERDHGTVMRRLGYALTGGGA